tara:strand:+ start:524 stop:1186 length:663 start_codon:yes stop_codon:yes gene_type:complete
MNVFEFIREKREDLQENTAQFKAMIEPTFRSISNKISNTITNTLNNPWIEGLPKFEKASKKVLQNPSANQAYDKLKKKLGQETYVGNWELIDQTRINQFADLTGDQQWIHTDKNKAKRDSPFKSTIAHGFLTLAMIPKLTDSINSKEDLYPQARMIVNYGLNQVRFPYPVKSGSRIRGRMRLIKLIPMKNSIEVVNEISIEIENRRRFACVAETVLRLYF